MLLRVDPHEVETGDFLLGLGMIVDRIEFARCRWFFSNNDEGLITSTSVPMSARVTVHRDKKG